MSEAALTNDLPTILAILRQERADGELVLEQNDGTRRLYWRRGELVYLHSDAAGEQFGNYLLRQGIIDLATLNRLLAKDERFRLGEKVVQWGLLALEDRDGHLLHLQEQVMVNALEHPIVRMAWNPGTLQLKLSEDLDLKLDHRNFIWSAFQEAQNLHATHDFLRTRADWKWEGIPGLLEKVSDLPLTPATAYALSFLGAEPIGFDTFLALSGLPEEEATRVFLSLWAVGVLFLTQGKLPLLTADPAERAVPMPGSITPPPSSWPTSAPRAGDPIPLELEPRESDPTPAGHQGIEPDDGADPEFLDMEDQPGFGGSSAWDPNLDEPLPLRMERSPAGPPLRDRSPAGPLPVWEPSPAGPLPVLEPPPGMPQPARDQSPAGPPPKALEPPPAGSPSLRDQSPAGPPPAPDPSQAPPLPWESAPASPAPPWPDSNLAGGLPVNLDPSPAMPLDAMHHALSPLERARNLFTKARQLQYKGLTGEAIHTLELSVQLDPGSPGAYEVWLLLGQLRMTNPAWATRSINAFQAAARIRPRAYAPWIAMGQIYQRKGFPSNALACFRRALDLEPGVDLPPEVDLRRLEEENPPEPPAPTLFSRFKSLLKGPEKGPLKG